MRNRAHTPTNLSRRTLLKSAVAVGGFMVAGASFVAASTGAWAMQAQVLPPRTLATLIQMARDIYPHDYLSNACYARAVKGFDTESARVQMEAGVALLDAEAQAMGFQSYLDIGWEDDRVAVLDRLTQTEFFRTIRGTLVTSLYNQPEIWPEFGYEGESFSKGGYLHRGFDDINWI